MTMQDILTGAAVVGGTLLVCQFVLLILGASGDGADADAHGGELHGSDFHAGDLHTADASGQSTAPTHGHHHPSHGSAWWGHMLSLRSLSAGVCLFGLTGLAMRASGAEPIVLSVVSGLAGFAGMAVSAGFMSMLVRMRGSGHLRAHLVLAARGTVILGLPGEGAGQGKVELRVQNRLEEMDAVSEGPPLPTGTDIVVAARRADGTLVVVPAPKSVEKAIGVRD